MTKSNETEGPIVEVELNKVEIEKLITDRISEENQVEYKLVIERAKENLKNINITQKEDGKKDRLISAVLLSIGIGLIIFSAYHPFSDSAEDVIMKKAYAAYTDILQFSSDKRKEFKVAEEEIKEKSIDCVKKTANLNSPYNPNLLVLANKDVDNGKAWEAANNEKLIKEKICKEELQLKKDLEADRSKLDQADEANAQLYSEIFNLDNNTKLIYIINFFAAVFLIASLLWFLYYLKTGQRLRLLKLKEDHYHRFQLASIQCDILRDAESDPELLIKKIFISIEKSKVKDKEELFLLLGKLKIPQRKSVEVRAELIKEIYKYVAHDS